MPTTRLPPLSASRNAKYPTIRAKMYSAHHRKPTHVLVKTCIDEITNTRFPSAELVFHGMAVDPGIHDVVLTVRMGEKLVKFNVYFKKNTNLPLNSYVKTLTGLNWHGDILLMKVGTKVNGVVNWRRDDDRLACFVIRRFVAHVSQTGSTMYPLDLVFDK